MPWPHTSPTYTSPISNGRVSSLPSAIAPPPSLNNDESSASGLQHYAHIPPISPLSASPTTPRFAGHPPSSEPLLTQPYTSPYTSQRAPRPLSIDTSRLPEPDPALAERNEPPPNDSTLPPLQSLQSPNFPDTPVSPLPLPANRDTKILLSLDGDGVRGLSTVLLVESLVNAICIRMGRRVDPYQIFDLIGGVSTTGLLAIMIGRMRMRVHRARDAYKDIVKMVFSDKRNFFLSLDPHAPQLHDDRGVLQDNIKELVAKESESAEDRFFDQRPDSTNV